MKRWLAATVALLLIGCGDRVVPVTTTTETTATSASPAANTATALASVGPSTSPSESFPALTWTPMKLDVRDGDEIRGVAAAPNAFVAVGYHCKKPVASFCPDPVATTWTSTDGSVWARHSIRQPANTAFMTVSSTPDGIVSVAWRREGLQSQMVALGSSDGIMWIDEATITSVSGGPCQADTNTVVPMFCEGGIHVAGTTALLQMHGIWTSADGVTWRRFDPAASQAFAGPSGRSEIPIIAATTTSGPHRFAAAAFVEDPESEQQVIPTGHPLFWFSDDGRSWTHATVEPDAAPPLGVNLSAITGGAGGYLGVGDTYVMTDSGDAKSTPSCWMSENGESWHRRAGGAINVLALIPAFDGVIAAYQDGATGDLVMLASPGDCSWTQSADVGPATGADVLFGAADSQLVIITSTGPGWVAAPSS
jgi:hypothetical protein